MSTPAQPEVHRLWKDVMRVGRYAHPAGRYALSVDRARMDRWVAAFARMAANGVRVTVPLDHSPRAADNVGRVVALRRVGDRLFALHELAGPAAAEVAARNEASIGLHPDFVDGAGRRYGEAIVHVALTPAPVVPGQGPWRRSPPAEGEPPAASSSLIAASRGRAGVVWLGGGGAAAQTRGSTSMDITPDQLAEAQSLIGGDPLTAETFVERLLAFLRQDRDADATSAPVDLHRALADRDDRIARQDEQIAALSRAAPAAPEGPARDALVDAAAAKRDLAVALGGVTPAVARKLFARLVRDAQGRVNVLALSRDPSAETVGGEGGPCLALAVFDALAENRPVRPGELTGVQTLSRFVPTDPAAVDSQLQQRMIALASGKAG